MIYVLFRKSSMRVVKDILMYLMGLAGCCMLGAFIGHLDPGPDWPTSFATAWFAALIWIGALGLQR